MPAPETHAAIATIFTELADGADGSGGAFVLNSGDLGLLRSLDLLSADDASQGTNGGATIAAHAQHLRYGLSLMNRWAAEGGNPFADASWDAAWRVTTVSDAEWAEIRDGLKAEAHNWRVALAAPRDTLPVELCGMIGSVAHLAYHLGAIRQIAKNARGPREGTFGNS
jgi:hypothetical protein